MASIATAGTLAELNALKAAVHKLNIALEDISGGTGTGAKPGRFTAGEVDALIVDVSNAITAATSA